MEAPDSAVAAAPPVAPRDAKAWFWLAAKVAVSIAILAVTLSRIHIDRADFSLARLNMYWMALALALIVATIVAAGFRWSLLSRRFANPVSARQAIGITFAALFVGQVLPSTLGVDAIRAWLAARRGATLSTAIGSLVVDRACGMLGLGLLILLGAPHLASMGDRQLAQGAAYVAAGLFVLAALGAIALRVVAKTALAGWLARVQRLAHDASRAILSVEGAVALAMSLALQALLALSAIFIARGLGVPLSLADGLAVIPAAMLVATIPISINGWGLREGAMIVCLGLAGIASADAFMISLLFGLGQMIVALPGAAYWIFARPRAPG